MGQSVIEPLMSFSPHLCVSAREFPAACRFRLRLSRAGICRSNDCRWLRSVEVNNENAWPGLVKTGSKHTAEN